VNTNQSEDAESIRPSGASYVPTSDDPSSVTHPYDKVKSSHGYSKIKKKGKYLNFSQIFKPFST